MRRVLSLGVRPGDDDDTRLRKLLLLAAALAVTPLSVVWGAMYWVAGAHLAALIPWAYVVTSLTALGIYALSGSYRSLALGQFVPYTTLPFLLMWALGGFEEGSAVAIWGTLAPILALLLGHRRAAAGLTVLYIALVAASLGIRNSQPELLASWVRNALFGLNLIAAPLLAIMLVRLFAGGREGTLRQVRGLVRRYLAPDLADVMLTDPARAELGGEIAQVTVLFADLGGYSTYAEHRSPEAVVQLLNRYFAVALPAILAEGGMPTQLPGDAVMAVFGAPHPQTDHARRACRAAQRILRETEPIAVGPPPGPRFHIGLNSGPALIGNIGSEEYRNFTAIGDTTNLASRLQGLARPGQIAVGPTTAALLDDGVPLTRLGSVTVKGRSGRVDAFSIDGGMRSG